MSSIVWIELGGLVERVSRIFGLVLRQTNHPQPHPGGRILRIAERFFGDGRVSFFQMVEPELSDAEKQVGAVQVGL